MIKQIDEFTGEVQDSYGNWHDSYAELYDAMMTEGERRWEAENGK